MPRSRPGARPACCGWISSRSSTPTAARLSATSRWPASAVRRTQAPTAGSRSPAPRASVPNWRRTLYGSRSRRGPRCRELLSFRQRRPAGTAVRAGRGRVRGRGRSPRRRRGDHRADRGGQLLRPVRRDRTGPGSRGIARGRRRRCRVRLAQAHHGAATGLREGRPRPDRRHRHGRNQGRGGRSARDVHLAARLLARRRGRRDHRRARSPAVAARAARSGLRTRAARSPRWDPPIPTRSRSADNAGPSPATGDSSTSPSTPPGSPRPRARSVAFAADPTITWVAIVDEHDRAVGLIDRHGDAHRPLNVLPAERLADVARRIASRPAAERHTPVVLCDERARLLGLVTLERVLGRLADTIDSHSTTR